MQDAVTKLEASVASAKTAADEAQAKFDEVNEAVKAYKSAIDELTDDYNTTLGYIENLKEVPKGEEPKDFSGGVNPSDAPSDDAKQPDEVPTAPNAPGFSGGVNPGASPSGDNGSDFNGGVNDATPPTVADAPEYSGGVNAADAPVAEVAPEFTGILATNTPVNENGEALLPPVAEVAPEFTGTLATNTPVNENGEALLPPVAEVAPEFNSGVNSLEAAVNEVPEYKGGANFVLAAVNEAPEYTGPLSTNGEDATVNNVPAYGETGAPAINEVPAYAETGAPAINEVPAYTLTTAGTNKDNTYQAPAPAAKAEDKKELPNTGGKDNVAVASLGFLGLFLGAIPFVKRKN